MERHLRGNFLARFGRNGQLGKFQKGPAERLAQLLEELLLGQAAFAAEKGQQRLGRTALRGDTPGLEPLTELVGRGQRGLGEDIFNGCKRHP